MIHLLDVNILLALCDPAHPHAAAARSFFSPSLTRNGWATCPLIENGFLRIFGSRRYPGGPGSPELARMILAGLLAAPGHQFWEDDLTLNSKTVFPSLPASEDLTDVYLLALAVKRGGRFATFDLGIDASLIPGGPAALLQLS
jgi:toxin-antitoxin system PIN domain toxin